jgi:hypothetical protein
MKLLFSKILPHPAGSQDFPHAGGAGPTQDPYTSLEAPDLPTLAQVWPFLFPRLTSAESHLLGPPE